MRKTLQSVGLVSILGIMGAGCTTTQKVERPYVSGGENYTILEDFRLGSFNEETSKHRARTSEIFGVEYYLVKTDLGIGMFRNNESFLENSYTVEKGDVKGKSSRKTGEKGVYVIEPERNSDGEKLDWVRVPKKKKADIKKSKRLDRKGDLGISEVTEEHSQFDMEYKNIKGELHYVIPVEEAKVNDEGKYPIYLIPVDGSKLRIGQNGRMIIINEDKIKRPHFKSLEELSRRPEQDDTASGTGGPQDLSRNLPPPVKVSEEKPYECPEFEIKEDEVTASRDLSISCILDGAGEGKLEDYVKAFKEANPEGVFLENEDGEATWLKEGEVYNIPKPKEEVKRS